MTLTLFQEATDEREPLDGTVSEDVKRYFAGWVADGGPVPPISETLAESALEIFDSMKELDQVLVCNCRPGFAPMLSAVYPASLRIMRAPRDGHSPSCPFENRRYVRSDTVNPSRTAPGDDDPLSVHGPFRERNPFRNGQRPGGQAQAIRRSGLSTVLFRLLQQARVNWLYHGDNHTLQYQADRILKSAANLTLAKWDDGERPNVRVGEMLVTALAQGDGIAAIEAMKGRVVERVGDWPTNSRPHGFQLATVTGFERDPMGERFKLFVQDWTRERYIETKPHVFGETDARRDPYVGIVSYALPKRDETTPFGMRCYLQPCLGEHSWFPVDSDYERQTVRKMLMIREQLPHGITVDIEKPLFDESTEDGQEPCRPDFVLHVKRNGALSHCVAVETMGYGTVSYEDSKKRTHPRMKDRWGLLVKHDFVTSTTRARTAADRRFEDELRGAIIDQTQPNY